MAKTQLPAEVHDHFRKANALHTYVQKSLGEATKHALETGQELLAAKKAVPHGSWETECDRLFNGSPRTARFYMQFARDMATIKTAQASAVLFLEGGLDVASKAARKAAQEAGGKKPPKRSKPSDDAIIDVDFESVEPSAQDLAEQKHPDGVAQGVNCPNCGADWWEEDACGNCLEPFTTPPEEQGQDDDDSEWTPEETSSRPPRSGTDKPAAPGRKLDRPACYKQWENAIGPVIRLVDKIAADVGEKGSAQHDVVQSRLEDCTQAMAEWMGVQLD